ncbi:hypothetical protein, conserved [Plasmodium vivax]|uniref:Uncharacterized protein n=4 Tax=Plasmodium vivax TaxID=5855 RepID=A5K5P8_PLAVS|nr:hypothetical protein, conserved [Plasmodium vivax]EDL45233.1 hypothetical protein, conserved [Plasmodium vivax]KMZ88103.1 hypothetical protein PVBG_02564 [Plasmodium vivax Brazil I]KMZ94481.1 hypothetical protein PVMG_01839 [Plasmodium vivax Mauritania I]KNA01157.1 hypothetical protein PVNG_05580 [Plasmodium vivax North Korean]|eukprot:XP_001614960.1 hypothetical protein [Plasmodium vivax Sal-1]
MVLLFLNPFRVTLAYKKGPPVGITQHTSSHFWRDPNSKCKVLSVRQPSQVSCFTKARLHNEPLHKEVQLFDETNEEENPPPVFLNKSGENNPIKDTLRKTKKFCNYLTSKLGRLNKKLREIKKLETIFYANPNILTESQQVKLSKKKQIKKELVLIHRYRKKYLAYKKNLTKNVDDMSPFFYAKRKTRQKRQVCTPQEFRKIRTHGGAGHKNDGQMQSDEPKAAVQRVKSIDYDQIPRNVTDYLVFNKVGTKEDVKILFGLKAVKINGNTLDDENYLINPREDKVEVFNEVVQIHESHYVVRKRFSKNQKKVLEEKSKEKLSDVRREVNEFENFFNIKQ